MTPDLNSLRTERRKTEDKSIIKQVQADYPENSKEALQYAIDLARIRERDEMIEFVSAKKKTYKFKGYSNKFRNGGVI